jgi:hypothetical protein
MIVPCAIISATASISTLSCAGVLMRPRPTMSVVEAAGECGTCSHTISDTVRQRQTEQERLLGERGDRRDNRDRDARVDQDVGAEHPPLLTAPLKLGQPEPHRKAVHLSRKVAIHRVPARRRRAIRLHQRQVLPVASGSAARPGISWLAVPGAER